MSDDAQGLQSWLAVAAPVSKEAVSFFVHAYHTMLAGFVTSPTSGTRGWRPEWTELYQAGWVATTPERGVWTVVPTDAGVAMYAALTKAAQ